MKQRRPVVSNDVYEKVKGGCDTFEEGLDKLIKANARYARASSSLGVEVSKLNSSLIDRDVDMKRLNSYILTQGVVNVALAAVIAAMVFLVY